MKRSAGICLIFMISTHVWATIDRPPQWRVREFRSPYIMSHEVVRDALLKTPNEAWFATWGGGITVLHNMEPRIINSQDGLISNEIRSLCADSWGGVWAAGTSGLSYIHNDRITSFTLSEVGLSPDDSLFSIDIDASDRVWFSSGLSKLTYFEMRGVKNNIPVGEWKQPDWNLPGTSDYRKIHFDSEGFLWLANNGIGMMRIDPEGHFQIWDWSTSKEYPPYIMDFLLEKDGTVLSVGASGLVHIQNDEITLNVFPNMYLTAVQRFDEHLFVGTEHGLYNDKDGQWTPIELSENHYDSYIEFLETFQDGSLWVGTREGAFRITRNQWCSVDSLTNENRIIASTLTLSNSGRILFLTEEKEIVEWQKGFMHVLGKIPGEPWPTLRNPIRMTALNDTTLFVLKDLGEAYLINLQNGFSCNLIELPNRNPEVYWYKGNLYTDKEGVVYAGARDGLWIYESGKWCQSNIAPPGSKPGVYFIRELENGEIFFGGEGWLKWKRGDEWGEISLPNEYLESSSAIVDAIRYENKLWFATWGTGLFFTDGQNWHHLHHTDGLPSESLSRLFISSDNTLWVGSRTNGLSSYQDGRWIRFGMKDGLPAGRIDNIQEDREGHIWAAIRYVGIARMIPSQGTPMVRMTSFSERLLPGEHGIFSWYGYDRWYNTLRDDLVYSWRILSTADKSVVSDWTTFQPESTVLGPPLSPGSYQFEVRTQDLDRNDSTFPAFSVFTVVPFFWQVPQFQIPLATAILASLVLLILWWRKHLALRRSEQKYRKRIEKDAISLILSWDMKGHITYANETAVTVLQMKTLGKNHSPIDLLTNSPEHRQTFLHAYNQAVEKPNQAFECRLQGISGVWVSWFFRAVVEPKRSEIQAMGVEITPWVQTEAALHQEKLFFRQFCDSAQIGVMRVDEKGVVTYINPVMNHITGLEEGSPVYEIWDEPFILENLFDQIKQSKETVSQILTGIKRNSHEQHFYILISASMKNGTIEMMAIDYSKQKMLEEKLARASMEEQERLGRELHDGLCQQLTALSFLSSSLSATLKDTPFTKMATDIQNLLNEAKILARRLVRGLNPVGLKENGLRSALLDLIESYKRVYPTHIRLEMDHDFSDLLFDQSTHLYRIVREACFNALKHAQAKKIVIRYSSREERYCLEIIDDGIGIPEEAIQGRQSGSGVHLMRYHADSIHANLKIKRSHVLGTIVSCTWQ